MSQERALAQNANCPTASDNAPPTTAKRPRSRDPEEFLDFSDTPPMPNLAKNKGGRPCGKKKVRPECLMQWKQKGPPTAEAWGFIRGFVVASPNVWSWRDVEAIFNVPKSTLQDHFGQTLGAYTEGMEQSGRHKHDEPEMVQKRSDAILKIVEANRNYSVTEIRDALGEQGMKTSRSTIWYTLCAEDVVCKMRPVQPWSGGDLEDWKKTRARFAKAMLLTFKENSADLRRLIFVDESFFRVKNSRKWEWCHVGEEASAMEQHDWAAGCHVWGCIAIGFRFLTNLTGKGTGPRGGITSNDYIKMLEEEFFPAFKRHQQRHPETEFLLVQDGARIHTSMDVLACIRRNGMFAFDRHDPSKAGKFQSAWPPHSPDFNVIENQWSPTKKFVNDLLCHDLSNSAECRENLWEAIKSFWKDRSETHIKNLVESFPRRLQVCIEKGGDRTGY